MAFPSPAMATFNYFMCNLLFILVLILPHGSSVYFRITNFDPDPNKNIVYNGDAEPSDGAIEFNKYTWTSRLGWATYAKSIPLWDSKTGKLSDFSSRFSFMIDTLGRRNYGSGLAFFLAPVGFQIPLNSAGSFLGLFNTTTAESSPDHIVLVEFDSFANPEWDPPGVNDHVGINNNSIASAVYTRWNPSFHSGDTADVMITYSSTTKNLSVSWNYRQTSNAQENSSLFYVIDLMKVLPQSVTIGFSATTAQFTERHTLKSWEFNSSLVIKEKNQPKTKIPIIVSVLSVLVAVTIIGLAILQRRKQIKRKSLQQMKLTLINDDLATDVGPRRFSYEDLVSATNNFSDEGKLGEGGFGAVYKGHLTELDMDVAVKRISRGSKQGEKEYITEVKASSQLRHRNLVQLLGWCHDAGEFTLVYEFMPNGSLNSHLFGKKSPLTWAARYNISIGLASALLYLHEDWKICVLHRDIKSSNIMLDSDFNVKLGDFGLARFMDHKLGRLKTTALAGTIGYLAPEYISTGKASKESDVFSFGVVILEIVTGRKSTDYMKENPEISLIEWVWDLHERGKLLLGVDERLNMNINEQQVECLMIVGLWCAHPDRNSRPSIRQALQVLNFEAAMPNLPTKMPVPVYLIPKPSTSCSKPLITNSSLEIGR